MKIYFTIILSFITGSLPAQGKFFGGNGDGFAVSETSMILPVNLLSFEAGLHNNTAQLSWTAAAQNISSFILEVSKDGSRFEWLAEKLVSSNTIVPARYGYADGPRTGLWYYRLKWMEADGSIVYSKILAVSFPALVQLKAYYDASSDLLTITKPGNGSLIELYSADGKLQRSVRNYQPVCSIAVHELPAGLYIVRVAGYGAVARFIKLSN
jgi:hypothetical protein